MSTSHSNFTEPSIVTSDDLQHRSFISFNFKGKPQRQYHGKCIGQTINPNRAKTLHEKQQLLNKLRYEIHKALESDNYPFKGSIAKTDHSTNPSEEPAIKLLFEAVKVKIRSNLSKKYKRNLKAVYRQFRDFISEEESLIPLKGITTARIEAFLSQFTSTGTYYMNKRRDLGVLFSFAGRAFEQPVISVKRTDKKKSKARLHRPYETSQLKPILSYLQEHYPKLHICCLLTYSTWLRPHEEARLLTLDNFSKDWSQIRLSGDENKGGKVRVVYVPDYTREALKPFLIKLRFNVNIFTNTLEPLNESYFSTTWRRAYTKMFKLGLVNEDQTIYSFRHTAAIDVYRRTKDVYLLQKLLGHSSIVVTLKYLRSLGELNSEQMRDAAPQLY